MDKIVISTAVAGVIAGPVIWQIAGSL